MLQSVLLTENEVASILKVSRAKLQRDRWAGEGLPFVKFGRAVRYRQEDIVAHLQGCVRASTTRQAAVS